jgi:Mycothiol maleylpyruvate isomerase N-terminal domain
MDGAGIEQAYEPFLAVVQAGGFREPTSDEGWSADMVVAHVTRNNDHWSRAAREVVAGGRVGYDNETDVDAEVLRRHLADLGGPEAVQADLRRSVRELAAAYDQLGDLRDTVIPVRIVSDGRTVADGARPVGDMLVGNATYHLQMHLEQMLALLPGD